MSSRSGDGHEPAGGAPRSQRAHQREATRRALVESARSLIASGTVTTMPAIARATGVSEATAYRYFPDLLSILREGFVGLWPSDDALRAEVARTPDLLTRIDLVTRWFAENVVRFQGAVRSMIALTITSPDGVHHRPGYRFTAIDLALADLPVDDEARARLRDELSAVISAEALFNLMDFNQLSADDAIATMQRAARTLAAAAVPLKRRRAR